MRMSLERRLNAYPPNIVRIYAKYKSPSGSYVGYTNEDLALKSNGVLTVERIDQLARMQSWDDVTVKEMLVFCEVCDLRPWSHRDRNRIISYNNPSKSGTYAFLKKAGTLAYFREINKQAAELAAKEGK